MMPASVHSSNEHGLDRSGADYSIFTSGVYRATAPDVAFPQEKPHFAELDCADRSENTLVRADGVDRYHVRAAGEVICEPRPWRAG
jgi:hypothetical protein